MEVSQDSYSSSCTQQETLQREQQFNNPQQQLLQECQDLRTANRELLRRQELLTAEYLKLKEENNNMQSTIHQYESFANTPQAQTSGFGGLVKKLFSGFGSSEAPAVIPAVSTLRPGARNFTKVISLTPEQGEARVTYIFQSEWSKSNAQFEKSLLDKLSDIACLLGATMVFVRQLDNSAMLNFCFSSNTYERSKR